MVWKIIALGTGVAAIAMAAGALSGLIGNIIQNTD